MSYWVYSPEDLPNPAMMGRAFYTPEYIAHNGFQFPPLKKGEWTQLPNTYSTMRHRDWVDKQGFRDTIFIDEDFIQRLRDLGWEQRGFIFMDHKPSQVEAHQAQVESKRLNDVFRQRRIDDFEHEAKAREMRGAYVQPLPYVEECYEILGIAKPYSVEALKAQRQPGEEAAIKIARAIKDALADSGKRQAEVAVAAEKAAEKEVSEKLAQTRR